jgi:hypothetical protein
MRMCDAGGNHCGIALCGRVDVGPLEYRGCGHADGHVHVLGTLLMLIASSFVMTQLMMTVTYSLKLVVFSSSRSGCRVWWRRR